MIPSRDEECWKAELDMYCNEAREGKILHKDTLAVVKEVFEAFPNLKKAFPVLRKLVKT